MALIWLVLLITILGGGFILLAQNWSPVLALIIFGQGTSALPLAMWILLAVLAGVLTSAILQFLNYLSRRFARSKSKQFSQPPSPRPYRQKRKSTRSYNPQKEREWENNNESWTPESGEQDPKSGTPEEREWTSRKSEDEDWDLEKPPKKPTVPKFKRTLEDSSFFNFEEVRRETPPPRPSLGSEATQTENSENRERNNNTPKQDSGVYDAKYRVIRPPSQEPLPQDEEEDWIDE